MLGRQALGTLQCVKQIKTEAALYRLSIALFVPNLAVVKL
jgi:hypothetical protein